MRRLQQGLSAPVILVILAVVIFFVVIGFKTVPVITEYLGVKKMIGQLARESNNLSVREIKDAFARKLAIEYVSSVTPDDLVINKEGGTVSISASYDKPVRLFGDDGANHVDLMFHFEIHEGKKALEGGKVAE